MFWVARNELNSSLKGGNLAIVLVNKLTSRRLCKLTVVTAFFGKASRVCRISFWSQLTVEVLVYVNSWFFFVNNVERDTLEVATNL